MPVDLSRLYVSLGTEVWPCAQISASDFPFSQLAQKLILNSLWFSKPVYLRRERWVCLQQFETSDASCFPNSVVSLRLPPCYKDLGRASRCSQPCAYHFVFVGLPKGTVLFPTCVGTLDHLRHPTRAHDTVQCHLSPVPEQTRHLMQPWNLLHNTKFRCCYSPLPKSC